MRSCRGLGDDAVFAFDGGCEVDVLRRVDPDLDWRRSDGGRAMRKALRVRFAGSLKDRLAYPPGEGRP